jgi:hypothetical protein
MLRDARRALQQRSGNSGVSRVDARVKVRAPMRMRVCSLARSLVRHLVIMEGQRHHCAADVGCGNTTGVNFSSTDSGDEMRTRCGRLRHRFLRMS